MQDCSKLYKYFNKLFDDIYKAKQWEMNVIRDKNAKIHHIDSELRLMFGESVPRLPVDPQWHSKVKRPRHECYPPDLVVSEISFDLEILERIDFTPPDEPARAKQFSSLIRCI